MHKKGFTIIEMVVAMVLISILSFGISYIFMEGFRSYIMNRNLIDLRGEIRSALKRMVFEIRRSEINPIAVANGFKIQADINEDGSSETIIYQRVGSYLRRTVGDTPDPNGSILLGNVSSASFSGLGTDTITLDVTISKMNDKVRIKTKARARCI